MFYWLLLIILVLSSFIEISVNSRNLLQKQEINLKRIIFIYLSGYMFCIVAFRYKTGRDYYTYMLFFDDCLKNAKTYNFEIGFIFINIIFKELFDNFFILQIFICIYCCKYIYGNLYKYSEFPFFSLLLYFLLYFFVTDMAITRQTIAIAIVSYGIKFIKQKKFLNWVLTIIIACSFHQSALLAFPIYFTLNRVISAKTCIILFFVLIYSFLFSRGFITIILDVLERLSGLPKIFSDRLYYYYSSSTFNKKNSLGSGLGVIFELSVVAYLCFKYIISKDKNKYYFLNYLIGSIFNLSANNFGILGRFGIYYMVSGLGLLGYNLFFSDKNFYKKTSIIKQIIFFGFIGIKLYMFFDMWNRPSSLAFDHGHTFQDDYLPYKCFLLENN